MAKTSKKRGTFVREDRTNKAGVPGRSGDGVQRHGPETIQRTGPKTTFYILLGIVIISCFAVYFNSLSNGFVYDDAWQVLKNWWITDVKYIPEIFSQNVWGFRQDFSISNYYRPAMHVMYMAVYKISGLNPRGFHLFSVLFHAANSALVFILVFRLLDRPKQGGQTPPLNDSRFPILDSLFFAFLAALLFATHPIHTEAVAWAAGLPDLSFTFFSLLSFYLYMKSESRSVPFNAFYFMSLTSFFLASLCKEPALTLPLIIAAYDCARRHVEGRPIPSLKKYIPFLIVAGIYFALRFHALDGFISLRRHPELSAYQSFINVFPLFAQYLEKLFLPFNLNVFYVLHPASSLFELRVLLSLFVIVLYVVLTLLLFRKNRTAFISLLFMAVPLLPVLYIPAVGPNTFAERYLYFSSFGMVLLFACLMDWARAARPAAAAGLVTISIVLAVLYSWATVDRNVVWKDDFTLFSDASIKSPDADMPRYNLGLYLQNAGKWDGAIEQYRKALDLNPEYADARLNLGVALFRKGQVDEAIEQYQAALRLHPQYADAHIDLGVALFRKGRVDQAIEQYQTALKLNPDSVDALVNLGAALAEKGDIDKAIEQYQAALKLNPDSVDAHVNLGAAFGNKGWLDKAAEQFEIALRIDPASENARKNLARCRELKTSSEKIVHKSK